MDGFERHFWKWNQQDLVICEKQRGRKRSKGDIQVSGLNNWMDIGTV